MIMSENIDQLSQALLSDERIVKSPEKNFLSDLLRRSQQYAEVPPGELRQTIVRIASEILAERACGVLGNRIMDKLAEELARAAGNDHRVTADRRERPRLGMQPKPPGPNPPFPGPPGPGWASADLPSPIAPPTPDVLESRCVVMEEFLTFAELQELLAYVSQKEREFRTSEVVSPGTTSAVDFEYRRSRVLMDVGRHSIAITHRLRSALPGILGKLGCVPFPISNIESQITASNHGDFFGWHNDNSHDPVLERRITFVYFFHREPKRFTGGELRLYDSRRENGDYVPEKNYYTVVPQQNQVVLFNSSLAHEITRVECPSGKFEDSRFTVNGWLRGQS
jgi:Rps23 Pro-64 3,4-dihydroxylase Tpa1-like proline 4-hydroxylase